MGGNVFNNLGVQARRINSSEFHKISGELSGLLKSKFNKVHVVRAFKKNSHGDIDFLISDPIYFSLKIRKITTYL